MENQYAKREMAAYSNTGEGDKAQQYMLNSNNFYNQTANPFDRNLMGGINESK